MELVVDIKNITVVLPDGPLFAWDRFAVADGERVVLMGPSGAGKTTLIRSIVARGAVANVRTEKLYVAHEPRPGDNVVIAYCPQRDALFPWATAAANIQLALPQSTPQMANERMDRIGTLFRQLDLDASLAWKYPDQLSGGEQQRVALARALAVPSRMLVLDEPLVSLDPVRRIRCRSVVDQHLSNNATAALITTHDVEEALFLADRVIVFGVDRGDPPREIVVNVSRPRNPNVYDDLRLNGLAREIHELFVRIETEHRKNEPSA